MVSSTNLIERNCSCSDDKMQVIFFRKEMCNHVDGGQVSQWNASYYPPNVISKVYGPNSVCMHDFGGVMLMSGLDDYL